MEFNDLINLVFGLVIFLVVFGSDGLL